MWVAYAVGSAICAALVTIFGKIGLRAIDPTLATIVRGIVMAVILVIIGIVLKKFASFDASLFTTKAWLFIGLSAFAGAASWILYFTALQTGPASAVAVLDKLSVVIIVLMAAVFFGESLTWLSALGLVLLVAGSALIIFK